MVGEDEDVPLVPGEPRQRTRRLVEDPVHLGDRARQAVGLPLRPAEVVDVVCGHEDDEEQLGVVAVREPGDDLDLLRGGPADEIEVELSLRERELVVQLERAEALPELRPQLFRVRQALLARGCVEAGDGEAVHLGRRPRERDVDDARAPARAAEPVPDGRSAAKAAVDEAELVAGLVSLGEVPDPVPARVDAGHDRRPGVRCQRMGRRAQDAAGACVAEPRQVGQLPRGQHRVDDVERRRVEAYDGQVWTGHPR